MGGGTKTKSTTPREIVGLRNDLSDWLRGGTVGATNQQKIAEIQALPYVKQSVKDREIAKYGGGAQGGGPQPGAAHPFDRMFTQGADQMGAAESPFFQNMMSQLVPLFEQQRADAVAAAKEGSGNLTGSGYANAMGRMMNRSMGEQQALMSQLFQNILGMEMQRQNNDAQRFMQTLLGMSTAGVSPEQIVQSGGLGAVLGPLGSIAGTVLAGPGGGFLGTLLGRKGSGN